MSGQQLAMPFNVSVLARTSAKHGRGLFATARIPKGTPIWRFAAAADCPKSQTGEMVNSVYTRTQLEELAKQDPEKIKEVLWGGYLHDPTDQFIHLVDGGQFTNHSDEPNCGGEWAEDPKDEVSIAIRDIEEGEEITWEKKAIVRRNKFDRSYGSRKANFVRVFVDDLPKELDALTDEFVNEAPGKD